MLEEEGCTVQRKNGYVVSANDMKHIKTGRLYLLECITHHLTSVRPSFFGHKVSRRVIVSASPSVAVVAAWEGDA